MSETATPGQQYDARAEADATVAAWNERDHAVSERLSDRLAAALQRAHDAGAAGVQARSKGLKAALRRIGRPIKRPNFKPYCSVCLSALRGEPHPCKGACPGFIARAALEALA